MFVLEENPVTETVSELYDIAVIGGGINGVGIAADAAGRGLSVFLCERDDLASHTRSEEHTSELQSHVRSRMPSSA